MTKTRREEAIDFVMMFYDVSPEIAAQYYNDEIESYLGLTTKINQLIDEIEQEKKDCSIRN